MILSYLLYMECVIVVFIIRQMTKQLEQLLYIILYDVFFIQWKIEDFAVLDQFM